MANPVNPNQFKLFYGARELRDSITASGDRNEGERMSDMWQRKVEESKAPAGSRHGAGVHESIASKGFQAEGAPTLIHGNKQKATFDAHHRIAAAADIEETTGKAVWVPVHHATNTGWEDWMSRDASEQRKSGNRTAGVFLTEPSDSRQQYADYSPSATASASPVSSESVSPQFKVRKGRSVS